MFLSRKVGELGYLVWHHRKFSDLIFVFLSCHGSLRHFLNIYTEIIISSIAADFVVLQNKLSVFFDRGCCCWRYM